MEGICKDCQVPPPPNDRYVLGAELAAISCVELLACSCVGGIGFPLIELCFYGFVRDESECPPVDSYFVPMLARHEFGKDNLSFRQGRLPPHVSSRSRAVRLSDLRVCIVHDRMLADIRPPCTLPSHAKPDWRGKGVTPSGLPLGAQAPPPRKPCNRQHPAKTKGKRRSRSESLESLGTVRRTGKDANALHSMSRKSPMPTPKYLQRRSRLSKSIRLALS